MNKMIFQNKEETNNSDGNLEKDETQNNNESNENVSKDLNPEPKNEEEERIIAEDVGKNINPKEAVNKGEGEKDKKKESAKESEEEEEKRSSGTFEKLNFWFQRKTQKVNIQSRINFARNLAIAVKSGASLVRGLEMVQKQSESKTLKKIIGKIIVDINNGQFLAQSLAKYKGVFGDFFINIIKIGEASGALSDNLLYLSDELKKQKEIRSKVRSAMIYPVIVFVLAIGIAAFLVFFILPQLLPVLSDLGVELPPTTLFLIWIVDTAQAYGVYIFLGIIALTIGVKMLLNFPPIHFVFDRILLSVPVISGVVKNLTIATFARALALLLKSGMPIVEALEVSTGTIHNKVYRKEIMKTAERVQKGEPITRHLESVGGKMFPAMFVSIIEVGEQTGSLEDNLFYLSDYYEDKTSERIDNLSTVIEPVLLLFMGLLVGFIAISIIVPIYQITQGTMN